MMRQGHNNKRMRGRNRRGPSPLARSYESNGPDVKIRGTALHIAEKYGQLARDAASASDRVAEQNYLQHAEHYYRIVAAAQAQMAQSQPQLPRADEDGDDGDEPSAAYDNRPQRPGDPPAYGLAEPQPYVNGGPFNGNGQSDEGDADDDQPGYESRDAGEEGDDGEQAGHRSRRRRGRNRPRRPEGEAPVSEGTAPPAGPED